MIISAIFAVCLTLSNVAKANQKNNIMTIEVTLPKIDSVPYHKPYVAIWLESTKREGLHTFAFWREQEDWYKDLRQWWRKIGRKKTPNYDGVSGATRKPGRYKLTWDGVLKSGHRLADGDYILHVESVREQGSREYLRQKITINAHQAERHVLQGKHELGTVIINIHEY